MPLHCRYGPEPLLVQQEHYLQERVAGTGVHLPLRNLYVRLLHVKRVWALLDQPAVPRELQECHGGAEALQVLCIAQLAVSGVTMQPL